MVRVLYFQAGERFTTKKKLFTTKGTREHEGKKSDGTTEGDFFERGEG
jgi:hypothetical protein